MANIKSAKKRILVNRTKAERNKAIKSGVKTAMKKVYAAIEANDKEAATVALLNATSTIDKAATKGVYHKNNASRKVSRLAKSVNQMALFKYKDELSYTIKQKQPIHVGCFYFAVTDRKCAHSAHSSNLWRGRVPPR